MPVTLTLCYYHMNFKARAFIPLQAALHRHPAHGLALLQV